jgi:PHD/YefM family antitoxin component YafN of YafNO toxin-antitoxin module
MFKVRRDAAVATVSELRKDVKGTVEAANRSPVYLTSDGKLVAAMVSVPLLERMLDLMDHIEDVEDARIGAERLEQIENGKARLIDAAEFWEKAEARVRPIRRGVPKR